MPALPNGTVTLLFTDIEGSTQLLRRLGDAYATVLGEHQRLLREAFAQHGGHEVDTQGDAFFVAFPRTVDAVHAAVAAQQALAAYPWPAGASVRVRMGLHTGEPTSAGGRYVGLAVHRAARVGSAGHGGQVLLSQTTQAVLRDALPPGVTLRDLGAHHLKDFDQPEHLYQVLTPDLPADFPPPKVADPAPLPPLSVPLPALKTPLVGRERELTLLREQLDAALGGHGGLVLIAGEAGVGKTTLAEALAREALDRGARVAIGRCYDLAETPPYGPWREALAAVPASPDLPPLPAALGGPEWGETLASQGTLFARAHTFLSAAAGHRPLVLLLDDLHWADPASLDLLRTLARQAMGLPLLLLATYRADELPRRHPLYPLLPLLVREARAARLELRALPGAAVRDLVRTRYALAGADEQRLAGYLGERAEGHPLFVGELLRTLEEEGALHPVDGRWSLGDLRAVRVPRLLRQVVEGRLDRLSGESQRLLAVGAVIGQEVSLALWAQVAQVEEDALLEVVEPAVEAHLLEETTDGLRVRFVHALIREALYETLPPTRRRSWHRRAGEALAAMPAPEPDLVAHHFRRAGDARAAAWSVRAGERAQQAHAWLTAEAHYEAALTLLARGGNEAREQAWLLVRLARVRGYANNRQGLAHLGDAARLMGDVGDSALAAYLVFLRGDLHCAVGEYRQGIEDLTSGVAALDTLPGTERQRLALAGLLPDEHSHRGTLIYWLAATGHYARARDVGERYVVEAASQ
jgi:class 3 adenylate cyclase/DNA polymerase III delta prime subunit